MGRHIADDLRALEQLSQRFDRVLNLGNFVVRGFDAGIFSTTAFTLAASRPAAIKGMLYSRRYSQNQTPRVARDAIDDDRFSLAHVSYPPEFLFFAFGDLHAHAAVDRQAGTSDEARLVGAKENSGVGHVATSPNRPSGVCSTTEATAAPASGASPAATMSLASCMPISVGTSPG